MISYQKKFIRIVECWNGETPVATGADLVRHFQQTEPLSGMLSREFYTVLIDLKQTPEAIFEKMKRGTRYEIRRALATDNLSHRYWNDADQQIFAEFCEYADEF